MRRLRALPTAWYAAAFSATAFCATAFCATAWCATASAQDAGAPAAPEAPTDAEGPSGAPADAPPGAEPTPEAATTSTRTPDGPASTASAAPASTGSAAPASAPSATPASAAAQPAVVVRRVRDDDEEEEDEAPPDQGDPYDILWIELFGGASYVDLRAIDTSDYFPEIVRLAGWGPAGGAALGFRVEFVSVGVRGALARYDRADASSPGAVFDVGTLAAEVKLALPIPVVQPFVRVGFGFAWHGDSNLEDTWNMGGPPRDFQTTVYGWVFQGAIGLDVYLAHWFAIGGAFSIDVLNMSRQPIEMASDVSFRNANDAVGVQGRGQVAVSFHM